MATTVAPDRRVVLGIFLHRSVIVNDARNAP
jgi:hypothetical protein